MVPQWKDSTRKHGVSMADAIHVLLHPTYRAVLPDEREEGRIVLFIGHRHPQALPDDEIEVLVHEFPDSKREAVIFHVMPLGPLYRRYREEHPHD